MAANLESRWVSYRSAGYLRGRGVVYGCAHSSPFPFEAKAPGIYPIIIDPKPHPLVSLVESTDLSLLRPRSMDFVFAGVNTSVDMLPKLAGLLEFGGHFIVHCLTENADDAIDALKPLGSWRIKANLERGPQTLLVLKYLTDSKRAWLKLYKPGAIPRACIARYGAIGDMIMVTPLIRALHDKGYLVTVNTTSYSAEVLENNPYVSNIIVQERDIIPNMELKEYWNEWAKDYELYINLSESIEGGLLKLENRADFYTFAEQRRRICNINYIDQTLALGSCSDSKHRSPELYFSAKERQSARNYLRSIGATPEKFVILWGLNGSSFHKNYPATQAVLEKWLSQHPNALAILSGNAQAKLMEFQHPQVRRSSGTLSLRLMLILATTVDVVVGPESALVNAASSSDNHKIVMLSHSSAENLTKYWTNTTALEPDRSISPCYPCHQLHYSLESCPLIQVGDSGGVAPACTLAISPERTLEALDKAYELWTGARNT